MSAPSFIELRSGTRFEPLAPDPRRINIEDIAHALSNQCRFSGHTRTHYSVAEHSVRVANLLWEWREPVDVQFWGLLHDASEAFLVDLPSPLKHHPGFAAYRDAEAACMAAVCERFGLPPEMPAAVAKADSVLLSTEARDLMAYVPEHWSKLPHPPHADRIEPWPSTVARARFLALYDELDHWRQTAPHEQRWHVSAPVSTPRRW